MPLVNRLPVDAAGKLLVTTTVPSATWPQLGGMTYDPTTGALAVIDAVPAANDPWVGGVRFTNLGSMYVTTTLPSPLFYVGGLPVSTDGRMFFSSNPPIGSVGGWPIAGDGGIAGVGLSAQPIFWAPLLTTLVPTVAGNPAFTFTRATFAYAMDNGGVLRQAIANEARFQGARRVRNYVDQSQNFSGGTWAKSAAIVTGPVTGPTGQSDAYTLTATGAGGQLYGTNAIGTVFLANTGRTGVSSIWIRRRTGVGAVQFRSTSNFVEYDITAQLDGTWRRFGTPPTVVTNNTPYLVVTLAVSGDAVDIAYAQVEDVSGQSNQAPGEYVSVGVLAAPYHGNAVDGVKYFATTNGNSVAANVVTEAQGTLIPTATMLGYVAENAATNLCLQSQNFTSGVVWQASLANSTITADAQIAPDGTLTADTFTDTVANSYHRVYQTINVAAATYTVSIYLKSGTLPWAQIYGGDGTTHRWANFNIQTGALGNKEASTTSSIVALPNGWYRCSITYPIGNANIVVQIFSSLTDVATHTPVYVGTGQTMYLWGAQVEQASDASSYIPTTAAAVTRNTDALSWPEATNAVFAVGTLYNEFLTTRSPAYFQPQMVRSPGGDWMAIYSGDGRIVWTSAGGGNQILTPNVATKGMAHKVAAAWSGVTASVNMDGAGVGTGAWTSAASTTFIIGGTTPSALNGSIRNVKFYNVRIADADLVTMTQ